MGERQQQVLLGRLPVGPIERYAGSCPRFSEPKEVASFSRGADRKIAFDRSALRRFGAPRLPAALDEGFETYVAKSSGEEPAPMGDLLAAIHHHGGHLHGEQHIVTYRNNLNKLLLTPFQPRDDWEIGVERRTIGGKACVVLHVRETSRKQAEEANRDEQQQRFCYWGYKFEDLCTTSHKSSSESCSGTSCASHSNGTAAVLPAGPVDANCEFCCVLRLGLDRLRILMGAEMDCEVVESDEKPSYYIELKTNKLLRQPRERNTFERFKLLKFWLQSYLAGVRRIYVGFRDQHGVVHQAETLPHNPPRTHPY